MTLGQHQEAFARDLVKLIQYGWEQGYEVRIGEVLRTPEQQQLYMQSGGTTTMRSMHLKKCAADLHWVDRQGQICYPPAIGAYWESLNPLNQWGGKWHFKDEDHYQRTVA